jgi:hypothetical protein
MGCRGEAGRWIGVLYIVLWGWEELLRVFSELYMLMVYFEYP